jgi:DNA-binding transcriptional MerR regulator
MLLDKTNYSTLEVVKLTALEHHHLRYYDKLQIFSPSIQSTRYKRKKYSSLDVLVLQSISALKQKGMPFIRIRKVIESLKEHYGLKKPFHAALDGRQNITILTDGMRDFYICFNDHEVVEHLKAGGQYMLLDVSDIAYDLKEKIRALQIYKKKRAEQKFRQAAVS